MEEVVRTVPRKEYVEVEKKVPRYEVEWVERIVEVPQIQYVDKHVEVRLILHPHWIHVNDLYRQPQSPYKC